MDFGDLTARHCLAVCASGNAFGVSWIALLLSGPFAAALGFRRWYHEEKAT
jgi:hypothetical protein